MPAVREVRDKRETRDAARLDSHLVSPTPPASRVSLRFPAAPHLPTIEVFKYQQSFPQPISKLLLEGVGGSTVE